MRTIEQQIEHDRHMKGRIHSIETFGSVDGPGIRFVLFMQGCALRCQFCHNPDTWDMNTGNVYTVDDVIAQIEPYLSYYRTSGGGVTFSGGEPSLQAPFLAALARELKRRHDLHIALDSSGFFEASHLISSGLADAIDLVLLDLKIMDEQKHIRLTSQSNERILRTSQFYNEIGKAIWIRHVVIPTITTDHEDVVLLGEQIAKMPMVERVELLPYHEMGKYKWQQLNLPYELDHISPPDAETMKRVRTTLQAYIKVPVIY